MVKVIIFDLGGVLFTQGTKQFTSYLSEKYGLDRDKLETLFDTGEIPDLYREGKLTRDEFWKKVQEEIKLPEDIETLENRWINEYTLIGGTQDIIRSLRKKYKLYFLSDNIKERIQVLIEKYQFLALFNGGVFSHEVGIRKPNPKIYELLVEKNYIDPKEAVYIDDKEDGLIPATNMGMQTIHFENPEQLRGELIRLGIVLTIDKPNLDT